MTAQFDAALVGHLPGGERFHVSGGRWVRPDGGPVNLYHFFHSPRADWSAVPARKVYLRDRGQIKRDAEKAARLAGIAWAKAEGVAAAKPDVQVICEQLGVQYPESKAGVYPELLRTEAPEWWGRQLRKADRRAYEYEQIRAGKVSRYCSDGMLQARATQKREVRTLLDRLVAICKDDTGAEQEFELRKLAEKSNANPVVRRAELMVRIRGFEDYATRRGHLPFFYTLTCPSKYHRNSGERWNGASPREAQDYLCRTWAKCRTALARAGVKVYGFRVAEPHKDGCPHWHAVFWFEGYEHKRAGNAIIRAHFLEEDGGEPGAQCNRVKIVDIATVGGSATGYIAKYICKNVDGLYEDPELGAVAFDAHDRDGRKLRDEDGRKVSSVDAAQRVDAWAACWGVRQFQQIGGDSVGVFRELRRLEPIERTDTLHGGILEPMREAADRGQWDLFTELAQEQRQKGQRVRVWTEKSADLLLKAAAAAKGKGEELGDEAVKECLSKWQEPTVRRVRGLIVAGFVKVQTRFRRWVLMLRAAAETRAERARIRGERLQRYLSVDESVGPLPWKEVKELERTLWLLGFEVAAPPRPLECCQ